MIYPPVNELVEKVGNRYSLVVITAKRARVISQDERDKEKAREKEKAQESSHVDSRFKDRFHDRNATKQIKLEKPILRALSEIMTGQIYYTKED